LIKSRKAAQAAVHNWVAAREKEVTYSIHKRGAFCALNTLIVGVATMSVVPALINPILRKSMKSRMMKYYGLSDPNVKACIADIPASEVAGEMINETQKEIINQIFGIEETLMEIAQEAISATTIAAVGEGCVSVIVDSATDMVLPVVGSAWSSFRATTKLKKFGAQCMAACSQIVNNLCDGVVNKKVALQFNDKKQKDNQRDSVEDDIAIKNAKLFLEQLGVNFDKSSDKVEKKTDHNFGHVDDSKREAARKNWAILMRALPQMVRNVEKVAEQIEDAMFEEGGDQQHQEGASVGAEHNGITNTADYCAQANGNAKYGATEGYPYQGKTNSWYSAPQCTSGQENAHAYGAPTPLSSHADYAPIPPPNMPFAPMPPPDAPYAVMPPVGPYAHIPSSTPMPPPGAHYAPMPPPNAHYAHMPPSDSMPQAPMQRIPPSQFFYPSQHGIPPPPLMPSYAQPFPSYNQPFPHQYNAWDNNIQAYNNQYDNQYNNTQYNNTQYNNTQYTNNSATSYDNNGQYSNFNCTMPPNQPSLYNENSNCNNVVSLKKQNNIYDNQSSTPYNVPYQHPHMGDGPRYGDNTGQSSAYPMM
jgi:hypothetical protein